MAFTAKEAYIIARKFGPDYRRRYIVRAQVQTRGRHHGVFKENGFKGGVHVVDTPEEVQEVAKNMCGKIMVCPETGDQGFLCRTVYITEELDMLKELYVGISHDRSKGCPVIVYGSWSEMPYEEQALGDHELSGNRNRDPKSMSHFRKIYVDVSKDLNVQDLSEVASQLGISDKKSEIIFLLKHLYDCFIQRDAEIIELDPLVYTSD